MPARRLRWIALPEVRPRLSATRARLAAGHARLYGDDEFVVDPADLRGVPTRRAATVDGDDATEPPLISAALADLVPRPVLVLAAWALVVVVVAMAGSILQDALGAVSTVVIPMCIAVLFAALLQPLYGLLRRIHLHRIVAAFLAVILPTAAVFGGIVLASSQIATGASALASNAQAGVASVLEWLRTGPLHVVLAPHGAQGQLLSVVVHPVTALRGLVPVALGGLGRVVDQGTAAS